LHEEKEMKNYSEIEHLQDTIKDTFRERNNYIRALSSDYEKSSFDKAKIRAQKVIHNFILRKIKELDRAKKNANQTGK